MDLVLAIKYYEIEGYFFCCYAKEEQHIELSNYLLNEFISDKYEDKKAFKRYNWDYFESNYDYEFPYEDKSEIENMVLKLSGFFDNVYVVEGTPSIEQYQIRKHLG